MQEIITGTKAMAQRWINAENGMIDLIIEFGKVSREEAVHVLNVYKKHKVIKLDIVNGEYKIVSGAFLESDVIQNAVNTKLK